MDGSPARPFPKKTTRVLYGAPGAGKSAILDHLEKTWTERAGTDDPVPVKLSPDMFMNPVFFAKGIANALLSAGTERSLGRKVWRILTSIRNIDLEIGVPGIVSVGVNTGKGNESGDPVPLMTEAIRSLKRPVAVMVDEFQNVRQDRNARHAEWIRNLHESAYGLPVFPVIAGLGDTLDVAGSLGLSRLERVHSVDAFSEDEAAELLQEWTEHFGLADGKWQEDVMEMMRDASFWPRHANGVLAMTAAETVRCAGNPDQADMDAVRREAEKERQFYYARKASAEMTESGVLLGSVMNALKPGMKVHHVIDLVNRFRSPDNGNSGQRLPRGMGAEDYINHLIHNGALHKEYPDRTVTVPIPSYRSWMIAQAKADSEL